MKKTLSRLLRTILYIILTLLFTLPLFILETFGRLNFEVAVFLLVFNQQGANLEIVVDYLLFSIPFVAVVLIIKSILYYLTLKPIHIDIKLFKMTFRKKLFKTKPKRSFVIKLVLVLLALFIFYDSSFGIINHIASLKDSSTIYEDHYVDPSEVSITFPNKRRNLIFIVLESMSTNLSDINIDNRATNLIPNLKEIALENVNFSDNNQFGGAVELPGVENTIGGLVGSTSGVNLQIPIAARKYGQNGLFLPGVTTIGEILADNGYANYFLMGSPGNYAGRATYFKNHGDYEVMDQEYLKEVGFIPDDYSVFWGVEDSKLLSFAKKKLLEISKFEAPFNFGVLTVDTHFPEGYLDSSCASEYKEPYANTFLCSDSIVNEFVEWIKKQSFYPETTIVLVGDHNTLNKEYLDKMIAKKQTVYNAFINSSFTYQSNKTQNRQFSLLDIYPTTLASIGVKIEGDRLGLGTNLFSDKDTLIEELGYEQVYNDLYRKSQFYIMKFY